jgi:hypothetical protein
MSEIISHMKLEAQLINSDRVKPSEKIEALKSFVDCATAAGNKIPKELANKVIDSVTKQVWDNGIQFKRYVFHRDRLKDLLK